MAVRARVDPVSKDVKVFVADMRGPAAGQLLREFAQAEIEEAKTTNASVLGRVPPFQMFINGSKSASLPASLKGTDRVFVEFEIVSDVLTYIAAQLTKFSPVKKGRYRASHILLADGAEVNVGREIPLAREYVFINTVPYARKIERGSSSEAPNGVYQATAALARRHFGNIARITYGFRTVIGGSIITGRRGNRAANRNPAVIVTPNA